VEKVKVFNSLISKGTLRECTESIFYLTGKQVSSYICFANVHMLMEAHKDAKFNKVLIEADLVTADGAPVSKLMSFIYGYKQDRIAGMDLLPVLLIEAAKRNKSVYFYGSTQHVLETIEKKIHKEIPNLKIAGIYSPPFRILTSHENSLIEKRINDSKPDLVFVALGCPKQELWMASKKNKINACMLGVGQAFLVYADLEKRLPKWMRNLCIEWIYRLYLEPGRLWKRYLINNSLFFFLLPKFFFKHILQKLRIFKRN
jgi:N-acetylglucosaminyldiphosphoundecaprenol N-acetyl-beta-D-mannosaminyltransferase